jgi:hypothetical protein
VCVCVDVSLRMRAPDDNFVILLGRKGFFWRVAAAVAAKDTAADETSQARNLTGRSTVNNIYRKAAANQSAGMIRRVFSAASVIRRSKVRRRTALVVQD